MASGRFRAPPVAGVTEDALFSYWLKVGKREIPLEAHETIIGRGEGCAIVVQESLVSRRHARIVMDGGRPYIEDLGSANGTFVNQARLHGRALLFPGDHVFVGTCEIEVVRRVDEERPTMPAIDAMDPDASEDRPTPASGVSHFEPQRSTNVPSSRRRREQLGSSPTSRAPETTAEIDGLDYLGHLADKMFTMGRVDAALKILSSHIEDILRGARHGQIPPESVVDTAGRYAVKLANETLDGHWLNAAIELHLLAVRPLREETIQHVASLRSKAPIGDDALIHRYYQRLRSEMARMSPAERVLCERVACLLPGLDASR